MTGETGLAAIRLPTVAEIEAATGLISTPDASDKVVRVNEHFAVKMGHGVTLIEAENMRFLAANSKVPVPKVYAAFRDPDTKKTYNVMQYLPGDTLQTILPSLELAEKSIICKLIKNAITELRSIPPPDYFGMLNRQPYLDGVFWTKGLDPKISDHMVNRTLNGHRIVFTHGDLQPKNIMVERLEDCGGGLEFKITLLDWESAGWYPEFWDFCNATIACRFKPDWLELVPDILDQYPVEFLMMQVVYASVFY
ncbi:kinase-like protein [Aspergillus sclerotioniger CBS 115572]|uniref:Kinase-like protein n=1 Tax=Aspergillus sclerotioniger CBS 115572 TaxID=1450535 RepID=A0A317WVC2_9EURO|nr:kinase-like protein [Aspergillus sclerotioniger CBS 115572]PWY90303.1 kinase-like protein [Aspergillus sclerotioniger CBS 115572]